MNSKNRWWITVFVIATLLVGVTISAAAAPDLPQAAPLDQDVQLDQCLGAYGYSYADEQTGLLSFVGTDKAAPIPRLAAVEQFASPEDAARGYFSACGSLFGLQNQADELQVMRQKVTDDGRHVIRFQQAFQGVPVFAGELMIQLTSSNDVIMINGEILPNIDLSTLPSLTADDAHQVALAAVAEEYQLDISSSLTGSDGLTFTEPELWIYDPALIGFEGPSVLAWRVEVSQFGFPPFEQLVFVNAQDGSIALSLNQLDTAKVLLTYDLNNGTSYTTATLRCNTANPNCTGGDLDERSAHIYAGDTYDFYKTYHNRDSINNAGMAMKSYTHYSSNYCNAFWSGSLKVMTYGDGCTGSIVVDDVVAHEITHGVTSYESKLVYANQSGAINESFSDIWGEFVDLTNGAGNDAAAVRWQIGEDWQTIRNMKNPPLFSDPDKMSSPYYYTGTADYGGVHTNGGVGNKAAYLITDGATFNGYTITGIGITKAAKIFYEVQTNILTSGATYANLGNALIQACKNLIGTAGITATNCTQVQKATYATEMIKPVIPAPAPKTPSGTISDTTPTFVWTKKTGATSYQFRVYLGTAVVYTKTVLPTACGTTTCSSTPTTKLAYKTYKWQVRAQVGGIWKAWSALKTFTIAADEGFNSTFNANKTGWITVNGTWSIYNSAYLKTTGLTDKFVNIYYNKNFTKLSYQARIKRAGCTSCSNTLVVRGTPTPTSGTNVLWNKAYYFQYSNNGYFSVFEINNGVVSTLKYWTTSAAIVQGGWNNLKVIASGSTLKFYINNTLVWTGTDATFTTGKVGIAMFRYSLAGDSLLVDWAKLSTTVLTINLMDETVEEGQIEVEGGDIFTAPEQ